MLDDKLLVLELRPRSGELDTDCNQLLHGDHSRCSAHEEIAQTVIHFHHGAQRFCVNDDIAAVFSCRAIGIDRIGLDSALIPNTSSGLISPT